VTTVGEISNSEHSKGNYIFALAQAFILLHSKGN